MLPRHPIERIAAGAGAAIDLLVRTNTDEWRLFLVSSGMAEQITETVMSGAVAAYRLPVDATLAAYRATLPEATAGDLLAVLQGDWYFRIPAMRLADAHTKSAPTSVTYLYVFAWRSPQFDGPLGACHEPEIPFVFDTLSQRTELLLGPNPPQPLADSIHAVWVAFASTGQCGWPQYSPASRATMRFDTKPAVVESPRYGRCGRLMLRGQKVTCDETSRKDAALSWARWAGCSKQHCRD